MSEREGSGSGLYRRPSGPIGPEFRDEETPPVSGLAHVAIAVQNANAVAKLFEWAFGARRGDEELIDNGTLRIVFLQMGSLVVELLEPRSEHTVARFLERRGPGLHHICLETPDIESALQRCRAAGLKLIDEHPRAGGQGSRVAFIHPKSTAGVLIELRENAEE